VGRLDGHPAAVLRPELPVRRARRASSLRSSDRRAVRLGALLGGARRRSARGLRRHLLDDGRRARALRANGDREPAGQMGLPSRPLRGDPAARSRHGPPLLPCGSPGETEADRRGPRGLRANPRSAPSSPDQGPGRAACRQAPQGAGAGRTDRAPARGPADGGAPAALRRQPRLPHPQPLGGPGTALLRGPGLRDADHHQRQPADERTRRGRKERDPRARTRGWRRELRDPGV
jgi:hypothetical protein